MNEKPMTKIILPDGWEEVPTMESTLNIPEGWEDIAEAENQNPFVAKPQELKRTAVLDDYENENKSFLDKVISKGKEALGIAGSAVQDVANIVAPLEINIMGENYDNPITGVKGNETVADRVIKDGDFALEDYNEINKLSNTGQSLTLDDKKGLETYNQNLTTIMIDKYGFDDFGIGEDNKYYATKGEDVIQINKDSISELVSSIYGDKMEILGATLGAKKGYDYGKALGTRGKLAGGLIGSAIGAGTGTFVDMLDSIITNGEKLNAAQMLDEAGKSAVLDLGAGAVTTGVLKAVPIAGEAIEKVNPFTTAKRAKDYETDILLREGEEVAAADEVIEDAAREFGGKRNTELAKLATYDETQKSLGDMFENTIEARRSNVEDSEALTTNLFNKLNINETVNDSIGSTVDKTAGTVKENVSGIEEYWDDLYSQTRNDIQTIVGNENIPVKPSVVNDINQKVKSLETIGNVQKRNISADGISEFEKDYKSMFDLISQNLKMEVEDAAGNIVKEDVNSYTLTGMMDLQRKFNDFFYKHNDKLTDQQKKNLGNIKTSIYNDIENYVNYKFDGDSKTAKEITDKWKSVNDDFGSWKKTKSRHKILQDIVDSKVDINQLTKDMINKTGDIDKDNLDFLGNISLQLSKSSPEKLDELYSSIVNNMIENTKVYDTEFGKNTRYIDFEKFNTLYDSMKGQSLNKTFGQTIRGREILKTLDNFRTIAKNEEKIQNSILKGQTPLSESARTAKDSSRDFLFGIAYAIRHRVVGVMLSKISRAEAFNQVVTDMAKQRRYGIKEFDDSIKRLEVKNEKLSPNKQYSKEEIESLKNIREEITAFKKEQAKQNAEELKRIEKEKDQAKQAQMATELKAKNEQFIKDNMLLPSKPQDIVIPEAQIQEGAKSPLGLDIQDRVSQVNTKQPSTKSVETKPTTFDEYTTKAGIDKQEVISKVELDNKFEALKKSPYYEEVVFNAENTLAKDARNKTIKEGDVRYEQEEFYGQGNENGYIKIDASYTPNDKYGTILTKSDFNKIQANKIDEELVQKIESEIAEREHADMLAQQQFNKEFEEAEVKGQIPFSNPVVGGATVGSGDALVNQRDYNEDGKVDERDIAIGAIIGAIGLKAAMKQFPDLFKIVEKSK